MPKTILTAQQKARIITFRGRMLASAVAQKEGCTRNAVKKIWSRYAQEARIGPLPPSAMVVKTSVLTGQMVRDFQEVEPAAPEPLIDHGFRLLELGEHQCSWPLHGRDEDGRLRFCGAPRSRSKLSPFYCELHVEKARGGTAANPWSSKRDVDFMADFVDHANSGPAADDVLLDELAEAA